VRLQPDPAAAGRTARSALRCQPNEPALADRHVSDLVRRGFLGLPDFGHRLLLPLHPRLAVHPALPHARLQPGSSDGLVDGVDVRPRPGAAPRCCGTTTELSSRPSTLARSPTRSASSFRGRATGTQTGHWWKDLSLRERTRGLASAETSARRETRWRAGLTTTAACAPGAQVPDVSRGASRGPGVNAIRRLTCQLRSAKSQTCGGLDRSTIFWGDVLDWSERWGADPSRPDGRGLLGCGVCRTR
jgi:hypothetical protein